MRYLNRGVVPEELITTNMTSAFSIKMSLSVLITQLLLRGARRCC